jgi:hypothetical protein
MAHQLGVRVKGQFKAKFAGVCVSCHMSINVGDAIAKTGEGYAHADCPDLDSDEGDIPDEPDFWEED